MRAGRWLVLGDPSFLVFGALARRIKALDRPEIERRLVDVKLPVVTAIFHPGDDEGICRLGYVPHVVYIHMMTRMDDLFDDVIMHPSVTGCVDWVGMGMLDEFDSVGSVSDDEGKPSCCEFVEFEIVEEEHELLVAQQRSCVRLGVNSARSACVSR